MVSSSLYTILCSFCIVYMGKRGGKKKGKKKRRKHCERFHSSFSPSLSFLFPILKAIKNGFFFLLFLLFLSLSLRKKENDTKQTLIGTITSTSSTSSSQHLFQSRLTIHFKQRHFLENFIHHVIS